MTAPTKIHQVFKAYGFVLAADGFYRRPGRGGEIWLRVTGGFICYQKAPVVIAGVVTPPVYVAQHAEGEPEGYGRAPYRTLYANVHPALDAVAAFDFVWPVKVVLDRYTHAVASAAAQERGEDYGASLSGSPVADEGL